MLMRLKAVLLFAGAVIFQNVPAKTLHVPADFPTINSALSHAENGDTVKVSPGTYFENISLVEGVVLLGEDPRKCIINGMRRGPVVNGVTGSEIAYFTLTNGNDGILCENASPKIHHNWIMDNEGSGIESFIALPQVYNNVIYGNRWSGIMVWGAKSLDTRIENNVVLRNGYSGISLRGPSRVQVRNNIFMENHEYGIYSDQAASQSQVVYNDVFQNTMPFNRYTKVNNSNVFVDPKFVSLKLDQPDFTIASRSPLTRRGYEQADIGLFAQDPINSTDSAGSRH